MTSCQNPSTASLDFAGPVARHDMQSESLTVAAWVGPEHRDVYILDAPYQRDSVWDDDRRRNLIRSLLMRLPVGSIVVNSGVDSVGATRNVIDGRQRIEAIRAFWDDQLLIPATWIDPVNILETEDVDGWPVPGVRLSGCTPVIRRFLFMAPMPMLRAVLPDIAAEAVVFGLINTGGVDQDGDTLDRAAKIARGDA